MVMEIIKAGRSDRQVIEKYGGGTFKVNGVTTPGSLLVFPEETVAWTVQDFEDLTTDSLRAVMERAHTVDVCLIGCGTRMQPIPMAIKTALREVGVVPEPMETGAACRTYNVLQAEGRAVAAALIVI